MKVKLIVLIACILSGCTPSKELEDTIQTIDLQYIGWACDCPQWMKPEDFTITKVPGFDCDGNDICLEIEPETPDLKIPDHYWSNHHGWKRFKLTGRFYKEKQKHKGNDRTYRAKTFRYSAYEYIKSPWEIANEKFAVKDSVAKQIADNYATAKDYKDPDSVSSEFQITTEEFPNDSFPFYLFQIKFTKPGSKGWTEKEVLVNAKTGEVKEKN